ncbi:MAG: tRNA lysidine(34) synthetase TilS [Planctomycetes bacterium]|nr:tRNA lysidine(34) synthetase TilS [Planctomycetota bacterium]
MRSFAATIANTIARHRLFAPGDRIVAAVSGGADSIALARILIAPPDPRIPRAAVSIAHVEHGIRGAASEDDARFVETLARDWGAPFILEHVDAPARARRDRTSLEVAARRARLESLERAASRTGASAIALGHNADDDAETIVLRIARGTSLRGLAGIPPSRPVRPGSTLRIIRPLIDAPRDAIRRFLAAEEIPWREDATNSDRAIPRNRVRLDVLPLLEGLNPSVRRALRRLGGAAGEAWRAVRAEAEGRAAAALARDGEGMRIDASALRDAPQAVAAEVAAMACRRLFREGDRLRADHLSALVALVRGDRAEGRVSLPEGWIAIRSPRAVRILRGAEEDGASPSVPLPIPGEAAWGDWRVGIDAVPRGAARIPSGDRLREFIDLDGVEDPLLLRGAQPGDRFHPLGAPGHTALAEFLRARRVPVAERRRQPVIACGREVVWVIGERLSERVRVRPTSKRIGALHAWRMPNGPVSTRASGGSPG